MILEEAAYCDEGFFYETVAPILSIGNASLVAISTLTSEINFYTRLIKMTDPATDRPLFVTRCIELACDKCKEDGKAHECVHMLHLVPSWQSAERHRKLKIMVIYFFCIGIIVMNLPSLSVICCTHALPSTISFTDTLRLLALFRACCVSVALMWLLSLGFSFRLREVHWARPGYCML